MSLNMFHPRVGRPENTYPAGGACGEEFGRRKKGVGGGENGERNEGFWGGGAGKSGEKGQGGSAERIGGGGAYSGPTCIFREALDIFRDIFRQELTYIQGRGDIFRDTFRAGRPYSGADRHIQGAPSIFRGCVFLFLFHTCFAYSGTHWYIQGADQYIQGHIQGPISIFRERIGIFKHIFRGASYIQGTDQHIQGHIQGPQRHIQGPDRPGPPVAFPVRPPLSHGGRVWHDMGGVVRRSSVFFLITNIFV